MDGLSTILKSLQNPTRREILYLIGNSVSRVPYSNLLYLVEDSTGKLNYHLQCLSPLIEKKEGGYHLSNYGKNVIVWLNEIADQDIIQSSKITSYNDIIHPDNNLLIKWRFVNWLLLLILIIPALVSSILSKIGSIIAVTLLIIILIISMKLTESYINSINYEITDTEISVRKGILTKTQKVVPFRTITNIELKQGILDRRWGLYTLEIQTAGMNAKPGPEEKLIGLVEGEEIRDTIIERIRLLNPINFNSESNSIDYKSLNLIHQELKELNQKLI